MEGDWRFVSFHSFGPPCQLDPVEPGIFPRYLFLGCLSGTGFRRLDLFPRAALLDALEQMIHAAAEFGGYICFEMQFGYAKKPQTYGEFTTKKILGVFQRG